MYVTKQLFNAINESYYRNFQKTDMKPLPKDFTLKDVLDMRTVIRDLEEDLESSNLYDMLYDLNLIMLRKPPENSTVGLDTYSQFKNASNRVANSISKTSDITRQVIAILKKLSVNSVLVGGCVRDSLLGLEPKDFDFATDVSMDWLKVEFLKNDFEVDEVGLHFLVMVVSKRNDQGESEQFEIAGFRTDGVYTDGRRPEDVKPGTIFEDAKRRDLTINALYYNLNSGSLMDPNGQGFEDILSKTLRFVGKAQDRLDEDSLRLFRFYRFLRKLPDFTPAPKDLKAVRTHFDKAYKVTTPERVRLEIERMVGL